MMKKFLLAFGMLFAFLFGNVSLAPAPYVPASASEQTAQTSAAKSYVDQVAQALPRISIGSPAYATELSSDPGFDTPGAWMLDPAASSLWTVSGSAANGNGAKSMQMLMGSNNAIHKGDTIHYQLTITGMTHGVVEVGVGPTMTGAATGAWVASRSPIADNFTTASGQVAAADVVSTSIDEVGAFRMWCSAGEPAPNDPVVYGNQPGRSHLHQPFGNTNSLDPRGNFSFWRTTGGTTCGNVSSQRYPLNRSAYWFPAMLDGVGNNVGPLAINLYYKGYPAPSAQCTNPADPDYVLGAGGACVDIPTGLTMIAGYNFATGLGGPADFNAGTWSCRGTGTHSSTTSQHLSDFFHGGCDLRGQGGNAAGQGGVLEFTFFMQTCWDGLHVDSPDHRSHVSYATVTMPGGGFFGRCGDAFPYHFSPPQPQLFWLIDSNFVAGKWHLSSDEMVAGKVSGDPGGTMHMDYTEAWSQTIRQAWHTNCIDGHKSCSNGVLADGTKIKEADIIAPTGLNGDANEVVAGNIVAPPNLYYPTFKAGISRPMTGNGTYSGEIVAATDGRFSLIAIEDATGAGFDGAVTSLSLSKVTSGHTGPVTITH